MKAGLWPVPPRNQIQDLCQESAQRSKHAANSSNPARSPPPQRLPASASQEGFANGLTCIDCHKGIAHELPDMYEEDRSAVLNAH